MTKPCAAPVAGILEIKWIKGEDNASDSCTKNLDGSVFADMQASSKDLLSITWESRVLG